MGRARELSELATGYDSGGLFGFRNRIINGDMRIDQRNNGASVNSAPGGTYGVDRWKSFGSGGGVFSAQRDTDVPNNTFSNSVKLTVTTADSSIAASDYYAYNQEIEGFNSADFGWGTSSAVAVTFSFWVKSSISGLYCVSFYNSSGSRGYPATFTISAANTWQFVSITIPGADASVGGTWQTGNLSGVIVRFDLGSGSDGNATANTWKTTGTFAANRTTSTTNWIATNGATFNLTGVNFEKGSTATSFDYRPYATEEILCYRYYQKLVEPSLAGYAPTGNQVWRLGAPLGIKMRANPTVTITGNPPIQSAGASSLSSVGANYSTPYTLEFDGTLNASVTVNASIIKSVSVSALTSYNLSAEL